jgi:hypothetical protein
MYIFLIHDDIVVTNIHYHFHKFHYVFYLKLNKKNHNCSVIEWRNLQQNPLIAEKFSLQIHCFDVSSHWASSIQLSLTRHIAPWKTRFFWISMRNIRQKSRKKFQSNDDLTNHIFYCMVDTKVHHIYTSHLDRSIRQIDRILHFSYNFHPTKLKERNTSHQISTNFKLTSLGPWD